MRFTDFSSPGLTVKHHNAAWPTTTLPSVISTAVSDSVTEDSDRIATNFGQAAPTYHAQAHLQRYSAQQLLDLLDTSLRQQPLPSDPILEIGCGTGFITELMCDRLLRDRLLASEVDHRCFSSLEHGRAYYITDLSEDMVRFCSDRLQLKIQLLNSNKSNKALQRSRPLSQFFFRTLNAEYLPFDPSCYSLIIGGFVAQWFQNLDCTIQQFLDRLTPGGRLLLSFPGHESFPEWRQQCQQLNVPFTAHPLPNPTTLLQTLSLAPQHYQVHLKTEWYPTYYKNAAAFFHSMKAIGAGMSRAHVQLTPQQMRLLLRQWRSCNSRSSVNPVSQKQLEVNYQIIYLLIIKR